MALVVDSVKSLLSSVELKNAAAMLFGPSKWVVFFRAPEELVRVLHRARGFALEGS